jgi:hypothetical protein
VTVSLQHDLEAAHRRFLARRDRRRQAVAVTTIACTGVFLAAAGALGAVGLLGWPAPAHVKKEIAAVDRGLPSDLRLNPDAEHARAVASTETATLYAASLRDGGSCMEIVTAGDRGRGATCTTAAEGAARALDLTVPFDDGAGHNSPVVLGGRLNAATGAELTAVYADATRDAVPLGDDRYFLFDVPAEQRASVHERGLELVARDSNRTVVGRESLPADWDDPAVPDKEAPLYAGTRSDESDFTKVYGLEGHVSAPGTKTLELDYGDGPHVPIPVQADGSYAYTVPADRVDDFMQPRTLVARDATGRIVASTSVAAVAYWRGRERGAR